MSKEKIISIVALAVGVLVATGCPTVCPVIGGPGAPSIALTSVPGIGSYQDLCGTVSHVSPCDYGVAVFIFVNGGWWTKPTFADFLTSIQLDGNWTTDITTGGIDEQATKLAAFLVPLDCSLPDVAGASSLPDELFACSVAHVAVERSGGGLTRLVFFAGHEWLVKSSQVPVGPGPNIFSDSSDNVWVDQDGYLHLKITKKDDSYQCAELISRESFGYGTYTFHLDSRVDNLDENVVLGLFTWSDAPEYNHREIDIEFSRWGDPMSANAQWVVQPWDTPGNMERFNIRPGDVPSTHCFTWHSDSIKFWGVYGNDGWTSIPNNIIHEWSYMGSDTPVPGGENVRMNLWLMWGYPPVNEEETEVVIGDFEFVAS